MKLPLTGSSDKVPFLRAGKEYEFSAEVYYKHIGDYLNYRSSAILLMNHHLETDVISTKGQAYGVELQAKKPLGKLNGWVSYTFSRSLLRQDDKREAMPLNNGDWYPSEYDRPHEVKAVLNFKLTERYSFSSNFNYATGPVTPVTGVLICQVRSFTFRFSARICFFIFAYWQPQMAA